MEKEMNVLGVILARGGSKGVPRKNIKPLCGVPLLAYTVLEAQRSHRLTRLVLSSEDEDILDLAMRLGCEIIRRPSELALDTTPSPECLMHASTFLQEVHGFRADAIVLLQPTTPFRKHATIDRCIDLLEERNADSVVTVIKAPHYVNPHWVRQIQDGFLKPYLNRKDFTRRQELPEVYWRNGQVYVVRRDVLFETNDLYGSRCIPFIMTDEYQVNIDSVVDFKFAEYLLKANEIDFDMAFLRSQYHACMDSGR